MGGGILGGRISNLQATNVLSLDGQWAEENFEIRHSYKVLPGDLDKYTKTCSAALGSFSNKKKNSYEKMGEGTGAGKAVLWIRAYLTSQGKETSHNTTAPPAAYS